MQQLELSQIQGFLVRDNKGWPFAKYFFLKITDANRARDFIKKTTQKITPVSSEVEENFLNIGFTSLGLRALGLSEKNLQTFSREFREGMVTPHRQRLLGDQDSNDPQNWKWGGPLNEAIHLLIMIFEKDEETLNDRTQQIRTEWEQFGLNEILFLDAPSFPEGREHFGFRESISQPVIIGSGATGIKNDHIEPGEFIMGYKNEYGVYPDSPMLKEFQGNADLLLADAAGTKNKDLGRNGTYFVLRQLKEDVDGFWNLLNEKSKNEDGSLNVEESTKIAAKMMGRWPGGAPLVKFPDKDPGGSSDDNDFNYIDTDKLGMKCPFGSHIRRTNPRDNFEETGPSKSLKLTRKHRIMRRVRSYGENFTASATDHTPKEEVGILFGCFVADISRQFEFIQYTWANYPKFKQLYSDPDPFIGVRENPPDGIEQQFTIPQETANKYVTGLKNFVTVKGGAYFFFPSVNVVEYLSTIS
jgi:Dyp-type peroxidase family